MRLMLGANDRRIYAQRFGQAHYDVALQHEKQRMVNACTNPHMDVHMHSMCGYHYNSVCILVILSVSLILDMHMYLCTVDSGLASSISPTSVKLIHCSLCTCRAHAGVLEENVGPFPTGGGAPSVQVPQSHGTHLLQQRVPRVISTK